MKYDCDKECAQICLIGRIKNVATDVSVDDWRNRSCPFFLFSRKRDLKVKNLHSLDDWLRYVLIFQWDQRRNIRSSFLSEDMIPIFIPFSTKNG